VLLACGPELRGGGAHAARSTFLYTLVSAAAFGSYFIFFALGSRHSVYGTLLSQRAAGLLVLAPLALRGLRSGTGVLSGLRLTVPVCATLALVGLGDVAANGLYGLATRRAGADLAVVTVLASLYPVATTLLARAVHGERLRAVQNVGVAAALGGVLLLNA
jgi:drug/metabolite transporter (DMT)-like permease